MFYTRACLMETGNMIFKKVPAFGQKNQNHLLIIICVHIYIYIYTQVYLELNYLDSWFFSLKQVVLNLSWTLDPFFEGWSSLRPSR